MVKRIARKKGIPHTQLIVRLSRNMLSLYFYLHSAIEGVIMKSFESVSLMKNESDAIKAAIRMGLSCYEPTNHYRLLGREGRGRPCVSSGQP